MLFTSKNEATRAMLDAADAGIGATDPQGPARQRLADMRDFYDFLSRELQALVDRSVVRLRALVLLPSRDLAVQVFDEFRRYSGAVGIKVGLVTGQRDFAQEQREIVGRAGARGCQPVVTPAQPGAPWAAAARADAGSGGRDTPGWLRTTTNELSARAKTWLGLGLGSALGLGLGSGLSARAKTAACSTSSARKAACSRLGLRLCQP